MKMNSSKMLFMFMMTISMLMTISSNNILFSWMSMEINLISFIPMLTESKKLKDETMKYLIIQSTSSSLMLMSILMNSILETPLEMSIMMLMSMLMKMGMMPTHLWMPSLMQKISWNKCLIMSTIQKIIPTTIMCQTINFEMMLIPMIISLILSPISGMKQLSTKKMMAYSSISNSPWMISSMLMSKQQFMYFMLIYSTINWMLMSTFNKLNMMYMNQLKKMNKLQKINLISKILSISGMPPMLGFFPKWMIIQTMIIKSMIVSISMILSSMMSMFMYMKMTSTTILNMSTKKKNLISMKSNIMFSIINMMGIPLSMILKMY
uniref:NADH dehydrogenase subunit 2 n=1 Tax=Diostrombus politus TaxID=130564 RepID=UPI002A7F2C94|nr:NADH dehydrogenase subunit 2 [Diostrombus politus]WOW99035.1 NADH dehydrogenase subunit 2 [Diostrombus politus]